VSETRRTCPKCDSEWDNETGDVYMDYRESRYQEETCPDCDGLSGEDRLLAWIEWDREES
jgi:hypothetical protein